MNPTNGISSIPIRLGSIYEKKELLSKAYSKMLKKPLEEDRLKKIMILICGRNEKNKKKIGKLSIISLCLVSNRFLQLIQGLLQNLQLLAL